MLLTGSISRSSNSVASTNSFYYHQYDKKCIELKTTVTPKHKM